MQQKIIEELKESAAVKGALADKIIAEQLFEVFNLMIAEKQRKRTTYDHKDDVKYINF